MHFTPSHFTWKLFYFQTFIDDIFPSPECIVVFTVHLLSKNRGGIVCVNSQVVQASHLALIFHGDKYSRPSRHHP